MSYGGSAHGGAPYGGEMAQFVPGACNEPDPPRVGAGSSIYQWVYRGKTTNQLYRFAPVALPVNAFGPGGELLEYFHFNCETIVQCSQAGEPRRSVKGNPNPLTGVSVFGLPLNDIYSPGITPSPWEDSSV